MNDSDPDHVAGNFYNDPPLTVVQVVQQPQYYDAVAAGQAFTVNANGTFIYFQDGTHTGAPGFTDTFTYKTRDGNCLGPPDVCPVTTVTITITPVNDCPEGENDTYTMNEGALLTADGAGGNPDGVILRNDGNYIVGDGI